MKVGIDRYTSVTLWMAAWLSQKKHCRFWVLPALVVLCVSPLVAQDNVNMSNGTSTGCSFFFFDSGGSGSNYGKNQNLIHTFQPDGTNNFIRLDFLAFRSKPGDFITIYDGPNTSSPVLFGPVDGFVAIPRLNSTTGPLTVQFTSNDDNDTDIGWIARVDCISCSGQPAATNTILHSAAVCQGYAFTLGLSINYNGLFQYQWQAATTPGQYVDIPGATSFTYTTVPTSTAGVDYRCKITCPVSGQNRLSTPLTVTPTASTVTLNCPTQQITSCYNTVHYPDVTGSVNNASCLPTELPGYTFLRSFNGHNYFRSNSSTSWQSANAAANALGGYLASVNSSAEQSFLRDAVIATNTPHWIGLNDRATEGTFVWTSGEPLTYTNWLPGEPDNDAAGPGGQDFVSISLFGGTWTDEGAAPQPHFLEFAPPATSSQEIAPVLTEGLPSGSVFPTGTTTVTYAYGSSTCSFNVTVNPSPVVTCPESFTTCINPVYYPTPTAVQSGTACLPTELEGYLFLGAWDGHHYFLSNSTSSWLTARLSASAADGYLASVTSPEENTFLTNALKRAGFDAWIGLWDRFEGTFEWENGEIVNYTNWASDAPSTGTQGQTEDFVVLQRTDGKWNDLPNTNYRYIVEMDFNSGYEESLTPTLVSGLSSGSTFPTGTTTVTYGSGGTTCSFNITVTNPPPATLTCPNNITTCISPVNYPSATAVVESTACLPTQFSNCTFLGAFGGHHYFLSQGSFDSDWVSAKNFALDRGGYLAAVTSAAENNFLKTALAAVNESAWIGLTDEATEGVFAWSNGDALSFQNWGQGQPNNGGGDQNYVVMQPNGFWYDQNSTDEFRFLVEVDLSSGYQTYVAPTRLSGPPSGSDFPAGTTTITYGLNGSTCAFNITVTNPAAELTCPPNISTCGNPVYFNEATAVVPSVGCLPTRVAGFIFIGASPSGGTHYFLSSQTYSLSSAISTANSNGGYVCTINSAAENTFLTNAIQNTPLPGGGGGVLIGYNDVSSEGNFVWANGSSSTYTNWATGEPSAASGNYDYVVLRRDGKWYNTANSPQSRFILEMPANTNFEQSVTPILQTPLASGSNFPEGTSTVTYAYGSSTCSFTVTKTNPPAQSMNCPPNITTCANPVYYDIPTADISCSNCIVPPSIPGFSYLGTHDGHSYWVSTSTSNWPGARDNAAQVPRASLVTINDWEENSFLRGVLAPIGSRFWIGLSCKSNCTVPNNFSWEDGTSSGFANWNTFEPLGGSYAAIRTDNGTWETFGFINAFRYVIEVRCEDEVEATLAAGYASGANFPTGTTTVTYSYEGSSCSFNVTVNNPTPTTTRCPSNIVTCDERVFYQTPSVDVTCANATLPTSIPGFIYIGTYNNHTYFRSGNSKNFWTDAGEIAAGLGGYLAVVTSSGENTFLKNAVNSAGESHLIGLNVVEENVFGWANGETFSYSNWATDQPGYAGAPAGVLMKVDGKWENGISGANPFLIEFDNKQTSLMKRTVGPASGSVFPPGVTTVTHTYGSTTCSFTVTRNTPTTTITCPPNITACQNQVFYPIPTGTSACAGCTTPTSLPGYVFLGSYGGHNYFSSTSKKTWEEARDAGLGDGARLVAINSEAEYDFLLANISQFEAYWLGLNDEATEGTFVWTSGEPLTLSKWKSLEPGLAAGEDFVIMNGSDGKWLAETGDKRFLFIIEMENCDTYLSPVRTAGLASGSNFPTGTTTITYALGASTCSFNVVVEPEEAPSNVTATPASISCGNTSSLSATTTGSQIRWYLTATGGTPMGSSKSGESFTVLPDATTTYYAETVDNASTGLEIVTDTFFYTGNPKTWTPPSSVTSFTVDARGAGGGSNNRIGGAGGRVVATLPHVPGQSYTIIVGGNGQNSTQRIGGGGGGFSGVLLNGAHLATAGGGGGANGWDGCSGNGNGGNGGNTSGGNGGNGANGSCGTGGTGGLAGAAPAGGQGGSANEPGYPGSGSGGGKGRNGGGGGSYGLDIGTAGFSSWGNGGDGGYGGGGGGGSDIFSEDTDVSRKSGGGGGGGGFRGGGGGNVGTSCSTCGAGGGGGGSNYAHPSATNVTHFPGGGAGPAGQGMVIVSYVRVVPAVVCTSATRTPVTVTVTAPVVGQPGNAEVCAGSNATFSISSSGTGLTRQWQEKIGSGSFTDLTDSGIYSGTTTNTLTLTGATSSLSGRQYRCILTSVICGTIISNPATLTVAKNNITIGNLVFNDDNRNGVFDPGDAGINGVLLNLYNDINANNMLDAGDGSPIGTATTGNVSGQDGSYSFIVCPAGSYIIEVAPSNFNSGNALYDAGLMTGLVSSPTFSGAPDPDVSTVDNDDNGNPVAGFGVATAAFSVSADNNTIDLGFKTPTTVAINSVTTNEGSSGSTTSLTFTVTRSDNAEAFALSVNTANGTATAADNDFAAISGGTLSFSAGGSLTTTLTVHVNHDNKVEDNETFSVLLSGAPAGVIITEGTGIGTINNDDSAIVSIQDNISQPEGTSPQTFHITLSNQVDVDVTVQFSTTAGSATAGSDYTTITNQTVTFPANSTSQMVDVTIAPDNIVENHETYTAGIATLNAGGRDVTLGTASRTGTITNDDATTVTLTPMGGVTQNEGNGGTTNFMFTATSTNPVQGGFSLAYSTDDGTATTADNDYTDNDGILTFDGTHNEMKTITVQVTGDNKVEPDEVFTVNLGTATAPTPTQTAAITVPSPTGTGTISNDEVDWGDAPDPTYPTLSANNGARHNTTFGFRLGATIDGETNGQPNANADGDGADDDGVTLPGVLVTNTTAGITVNVAAFNPGRLDAWVDFDHNGSFDAGEKILNNAVVIAGDNALSFPVPAGALPGISYARFRLSSVGGLNPTGSASDGEVEDYKVEIVNTQFSIDDPIVTEGNAPNTSNLTFTISRTVNANACSVDYAITGGTATSGTDYQVFASGTANFAAGGAMSTPITVTVIGDNTVELNETVVMTLSNPVSASILDGTGIGEITNDDQGVITISSPTVTEGDAGTVNATFNITMSNPSDANVALSYAAQDGTATLADNDFQSTVGNHTLTPGQTMKTVHVPVVGDCAIEPNEQFALRLSALTANGRNVILSGNNPTLDGTGTITNDDALPEITCPSDAEYDTDPGACSALITLPLPTLGSICGSSTLEWRRREVDGSNQPLQPYSAYLPSTNRTATCNKGRYEIEWQVTDGSGTSTCSYFIEIEDNELPGITCPGSVTVTCSSNVPPVDLNAVTATDNCPGVGKSHVGDATTNMTCANRKTVTRTYRATDASGNSTTCAQVITVFDNVKPVFTFVPANVTVQCNSVPAVGTPSASDGCGGSVGIVYNGQTVSNILCTDKYTLTRQWTATDACGNTQTATQRITVIDSQQPNFTSAPANVTVQCDAIPAPATPTATDNCDAMVAISYIGQTTTSGACPNAYTLTRRWVATDNCNNTRSISQRITVVDNGKPVFTTFPANTSIACDETPPAVGTPTASDGCGGTVTITYLSQSSTSGNCPGDYQIKRTWRATDACGNSTVATQTIQVSDTGVPVFTTVPGPLTIECSDPLPPLVNPTASDACGGYAHITFLGNVPSGSGCAQNYTVTRTWRTEDLCGNSATTTQVITVLGNSYEEEGAENREEDATGLIAHRSSLIVTPNPTTDRFWLDLSDFAGEAITVSIHSDLGQLVWERRIPAVENLKFPVSLREAGAATGIYTVSVRSASSVVATRVVLVE